MSNSLGVLIVGGGWVSSQHLASLQKNPNTEAVGICGIPLANAHKCAATPCVEMIFVKFSNGVLGRVCVDFEYIQPYSFPLCIFGDKGTVKDNRSLCPQKSKEWETLTDIGPESSDVKHHPFQSEINHLVECILTDKESHCNLDDAVLTHNIIFAAQTCYTTGRPLHFDA